MTIRPTHLATSTPWMRISPARAGRTTECSRKTWMIENSLPISPPLPLTPRATLATHACIAATAPRACLRSLPPTPRSLLRPPTSKSLRNSPTRPRVLRKRMTHRLRWTAKSRSPTQRKSRNRGLAPGGYRNCSTWACDCMTSVVGLKRAPGTFPFLGSYDSCDPHDLPNWDACAFENFDPNAKISSVPRIPRKVILLHYLVLYLYFSQPFFQTILNKEKIFFLRKAKKNYSCALLVNHRGCTIFMRFFM